MPNLGFWLWKQEVQFLNHKELELRLAERIVCRVGYASNWGTRCEFAVISWTLSSRCGYGRLSLHENAVGGQAPAI